jgi:hypothetical protein
MMIGYSILLAGGLLLADLGMALAQFAPPSGGAPPCYNEILPLRNETEKRGQAIQKAGQRKAPREEVCKLFNSFTAAEAKYVKYAEANAAWCGIPPTAVKQMKANHARSMSIRKQVCSTPVAAKPRGPSLSDALGTTSVPSATTTQTGRGTYDSLTGNPLAR